VVKYFSIRDDSGEIAVVTNKPLPKKGETIKVKGKVQEAFSLGTETLLVIIETEK
jgi:cob(I)alamin adenosyltransferase